MKLKKTFAKYFENLKITYHLRFPERKSETERDLVKRELELFQISTRPAATWSGPRAEMSPVPRRQQASHNIGEFSTQQQGNTTRKRIPQMRGSCGTQ